MKTGDLEKVLVGLQEKGRNGDVAALKGARSALKGYRVPGHRISMSDKTVRISGPSAPAVASKVAQMTGKAAQKALREELP